MKTDDDAFVRVDEILTSMDRIKVNHGLLYGLINSDSQPHRNPESKWYISPEVIAYDFFSSYAFLYTHRRTICYIAVTLAGMARRKLSSMGTWSRIRCIK